MSAIVETFRRCQQAAPRRPMVHLAARGAALSGDEIWRAHLAYAERLQALGLEPGHVVVSALGNRAPAVPLVLACRRLGLVLMPVDAGTTAAEIDGLQVRYGTAALVRPAAPADGQSAPLLDDLAIVARADAAPPQRYPGVAVMKLTSGSTGLPKATLTTEDQLIADSTQIVAGMRILPGDTQVAVIPLSHAYGFSVVLMPLLLQGTAMVLRESFVPQQFPDDVRQHGATRFPGVPYMFSHFLANPPDDWPEGIRGIMSAGAPLPPDVARQFRQRFGVKIQSFYGTTESGGIAYDDGDDENDDTVGSPLPGVSVTFRAAEAAPPGGGRIHVRSAGASSGYAGGADDEAFCDGGYLTGDVGVFDDRGHLRLTGRVSSFVNVAGRKVQPLEVEGVLLGMAGVADVRVLAATDVHRGEQLVACVVRAAAGPSPTTLDVRRFCSARLAPHKIPRVIVFLPAIPVTARGKTDRQALDALVRAELGMTS